MESNSIHQPNYIREETSRQHHQKRLMSRKINLIIIIIQVPLTKLGLVCTYLSGYIAISGL